MKKIMLIIIPFILAIVVFGVFLFFSLKEEGKGALQVTSIPKSKVYLNGKEVGTTPLCKCELPDILPIGDYQIKLVPDDKNYSSFDQKITIKKSVLTVVDRTFGSAAASDGSIITLTALPDKKAKEMLVLSFPDKADVFVDGISSGTTPFLQKTITASDHEVTLKKGGYKDKTVRVRAVLGYKLEIVSFLGVSDHIASTSAALDITQPESSKSATLSAQQSAAKVVILTTPTGFLRVRESASTSSLEIAKVNPGETYELVEEKPQWFSIRLTDGKVGWVSAQFAKKE